MRSFAGKVAAITGAASGMGRSLAVILARRGCEVAISDIDEVGLAETARLAEAAKPGIRITKKWLDVADAEAMKAWAREVATEHGRVNLIFNNAGVSYSATIEGTPQAEFDRIIDIDFWGVVHGTRAFLPYLRASGDGHVVNTSSLFGLIAFPGQCTYNSAKFAVRGFTEALRLELEMTGAPVSASCVHPGGIKTNIARASKVHSSMADLGIDDHEVARKNFEKAFRVSADEAAEIILKGVQRNDARILVGADARILDVVQRILPGTYAGLLARISKRVVARSQRAAKATP